jgi:hypothetical protein
MLDTITVRNYREHRAMGRPASAALAWAREQERQRAVLARLGSWTFDGSRYGRFAYADLENVPNGFIIRVSVGDEGVVDWGDIAPSDDEREASASYFVAVEVLDTDGMEVYGDSIGGIDVIDLPGYLQRDWEDAVAYALLSYLLEGAEHFVAHERAEAAHWAARDTITV